MTNAHPPDVSTQKRFALRGVPDVEFEYDRRRRTVSSVVYWRVQVGASLFFALFAWVMIADGIPFLPDGWPAWTAGPLMLLFIAPAFCAHFSMRADVRRLAAEAAKRLKAVSVASESVHTGRILIRGGPPDIASVLAATTSADSSRFMRWCLFSMWAVRFPAVGAWLLFHVVRSFGRIPVLAFGLPTTFIIFAASIGIWIAVEYLQTRFVIIEGHRIKTTETSWLGSERVLTEMRLSNAIVRADFFERKLVVALNDGSPLEIDLRHYLNPHRVVGVVIANAVDVSAEIPLDGISDWGRVYEYGQ